VSLFDDVYEDDATLLAPAAETLLACCPRRFRRKAAEKRWLASSKVGVFQVEMAEKS
jgi:hypothetical protein